MKRLLPLILLLITAHAAARQENGMLGMILRPNNGLPALVTAGGTFKAQLSEKATLSLVDAHGVESPLESHWKELPGSRFEATCTVPEQLQPGSYTMLARAGNQMDRTVRSVYLRKNFPEYYVIAHISDTHIGKDHRHPRSSDAIIADLMASVNQSDASLVLITGDLTETGSVAEFQRFLPILDSCRLPTFVCVGNHDRQALNYEAFFGPLTYTFRFGKDGYLVFDSKDFCTADELGEQDGLLQRYRREIKACRWSVGVTHRYEAMMGMRSQLTLFVDDPLHFLLFGHWHRENTAEERSVPWGRTPIFVVPAAIDGAMRLLDMTSSGLLPRPVAYGASLTE